MQMTTLTKMDLESRVMIFAINFFGEGQHPAADIDNLGFFSPDYARECLARMLDSPKVNERAKQLAARLIANSDVLHA